MAKRVQCEYCGHIQTYDEFDEEYGYIICDECGKRIYLI